VAGTTAQTVISPLFGEIIVEKMSIELPGFLPAAAAEPTTWVITFLSDTGKNEVLEFPHLSSVSKIYPISLPKGTRITMPSCSIPYNATTVTGAGTFQALSENLFVITATGAAAPKAIVRLTFRGTIAFGCPALITATAGSIVGVTCNALDCIAPTATAAYPTLSVGQWLMTPLMPAAQCRKTAPAAFTRTIG
jgi:hypothetical protein